MMMNYKETGKKFKQLREQAGLSQKEVAAEIGLTPNSVYFWESDRTFPKPELWDQLIDMYKVDREEFISLAGGEASSRVQRYLNQHQTRSDSGKKLERGNRRIYLRPKAKSKQSSEPKTVVHRERQDQVHLLQRITDLEQKFADMESSMMILKRAEDLLNAWDEFQKALKVG